MPRRGGDDVDVLVVGAGPTGLALAAMLAPWGVRLRIVDRLPDRVHESRALALQPRTLEVLAPLGLGDRLVARGNRGVRLQVHVGPRTVELPLFDIGLDDTAYPFLLFLSQAHTEAVLGDHLRSRGVTLERGVELVGLEQDDDGVTCRLRRGAGAGSAGTETETGAGTGTEEVLRARYVVGCDGPRSTVRRLAGIRFVGSSYPQDFVLADLEADVLDPGAAHGYLSEDGPLLFFPLVSPTTWRVIGMRPPGTPVPPDGVTLPDLQHLADRHTGGTVHLHDPDWMTDFRLQLRRAERYRAGRVLVAGDAAHVHSPVGAQGMNTGIQDAANLAWKLALVLAGRAPAALLDTYEEERAPVGRAVLRLTDRAFTLATSSRPAVRWARARVAPVALGVATHAHGARALVFRTVAELRITYRGGALSRPTAPTAWWMTAWRIWAWRSPRPGDRLPDALTLVRGRTSTLHRVLDRPPDRPLDRPCFHLLLWDPHGTCPPSLPAAVAERYAGLVAVHRLGPRRSGADVQDLAGQLARRLGLSASRPAHLLVRPDGHVAHRGGADALSMGSLRDYLETWLTPAVTPSAPTTPAPATTPSAPSSNP